MPGADASPLSLTAPETQQLLTPAFRNAKLAEVAAAVSSTRLRTPHDDVLPGRMTSEAFYAAFLTILVRHGLVAVRAGDGIKVLPIASAVRAGRLQLSSA